MRLEKEVKNQSLLDRIEEKDSSSEHGLILYEHNDQPPFDDQGLAFQTHALQIILFGPFNAWTQYHFGVVTNWVLIIGAVYGKACVLAQVVGQESPPITPNSPLSCSKIKFH